MKITHATQLVLNTAAQRVICSQCNCVQQKSRQCADCGVIITGRTLFSGLQTSEEIEKWLEEIGDSSSVREVLDLVDQAANLWNSENFDVFVEKQFGEKSKSIDWQSFDDWGLFDKFLMEQLGITEEQAYTLSDLLQNFSNFGEDVEEKEETTVDLSGLDDALSKVKRVGIEDVKDDINEILTKDNKAQILKHLEEARQKHLIDDDQLNQLKKHINKKKLKAVKFARARKILAMALDIDSYNVFDKNLGSLSTDNKRVAQLKIWAKKQTLASIQTRIANGLEHGNIAIGITWDKFRALIHEYNRRAVKLSKPLLDEVEVCRLIKAAQKDDLKYDTTDAYATADQRRDHVDRILQHFEGDVENTDLYEPNSTRYQEQYVRDYPQGDGKDIDYGGPIEPGLAAFLIWKKIKDNPSLEPTGAVEQFLNTQVHAYSSVQKMQLTQELRKIGIDVDASKIKAPKN